MDNLSLVCLPPSEDDDWGDDDDGDDDVQILPSPVLARSEDGLFLRCSPQCEDEDDDDDGDVDCDDDDDVQYPISTGILRRFPQYQFSSLDEALCVCISN
nr:aspartate-rich protein 1-like isoform X5 [Macaca fascicularis]